MQEHIDTLIRGIERIMQGNNIIVKTPL
jgi:hypothetical protein